MKVCILSDAQEDTSEAFDWYAKQSPEAAQRFLDAFDSTLKRIEVIGKSLALVDSTRRECAIKKFPYRVVYELEDGVILIVAVAHTRRKRMFWRRRE